MKWVAMRIEAAQQSARAVDGTPGGECSRGRRRPGTARDLPTMRPIGSWATSPSLALTNTEGNSDHPSDAHRWQQATGAIGDRARDLKEVPPLGLRVLWVR